MTIDQTSTIPSPADFLTGDYPSEDQDYEAELTPLERLADVERRMVALEDLVTSGNVPGGVELVASDRPCVDCAEHQNAADSYREQLADLKAKHGVVLQLIEEIGTIVKKSTSKVSLEVKAAIDAWANPELPGAGEQDTEPVELVHAVPTGGRAPCGVHYTNGTFGVDPTCPECVAAEPACACGSPDTFSLAAGEVVVHRPDGCTIEATGPLPPAHDADVEAWAQYAESLGHEVPEHMNRSQIRTMLGVDQPVGA